MKILILEDSPERVSAFLARIPGPHDLTFCNTAQDCIQHLKSEIYDWLSLDHDLADAETPNPGTGYDVAKWLEENPDRVPGVVMVHSANPVGQSNLRAALPQAILAPNLWEYVDEVITKLNL